MSKVTWRTNEVEQGFEIYKRKATHAIYSFGQQVSAEMETYAKVNAPWTDRTGNARQGLRGWVEKTRDGKVRVYLSHSVIYGINLETKYQGRYQILWPTIRAHQRDVRNGLKRIFS